MKWDIDKVLKDFEPESAPGTIITRTIMDVLLLRKHGIKPTEKEGDQGFAVVWSVGLGSMQSPKAFFYGRTIRGAFLRARQVAKMKGGFEAATPWGAQTFQPNLKPKSREDRRRAK